MKRKLNIIEYKDYIGEFKYDPDDDMFTGIVVNINDVVTFCGRSIDELKQALKDSVEDYIETCSEIGDEPEKPFSGTVYIRMDPNMHRELSTAAKINRMSINKFVINQLEKTLHG